MKAEGIVGQVAGKTKKIVESVKNVAGELADKVKDAVDLKRGHGKELVLLIGFCYGEHKGVLFFVGGVSKI